MPARQETKEIKDNQDVEHKYFVIQKPADQGEILKYKLFKMFGPALGKLKGLKIKDKKIDSDIALEAIGEVIQTLFENTEPEIAMDFLKKIIKGVRRDGVVVDDTNFNNFYTDNIMEFYKAVFFVLEVNFGNFSKGLKLESKIAEVKKILLEE